jgi:hypothetical protein
MSHQNDALLEGMIDFRKRLDSYLSDFGIEIGYNEGWFYRIINVNSFTGSKSITEKGDFASWHDAFTAVLKEKFHAGVPGSD